MRAGFARSQGRPRRRRKALRMERFLIGVNYWPRTRAMAMWSRSISARSTTTSRASPRSGSTSCASSSYGTTSSGPGRDVAHGARPVRSVLDRAHAHGLRAMPTLFCGHMSRPSIGFPHDGSIRRISARASARSRVAGESPLGIGDFYTGELLEAQTALSRVRSASARANTPHSFFGTSETSSRTYARRDIRATHNTGAPP